MRKYLLSVLFLLLFLVGCRDDASTEQSVKTENAEETAMETLCESISETLPETENFEVQPETYEFDENSHVHQWKAESVTEADCTQNGLSVSLCDCGAKKEEVLLSYPHEYVLQGCGIPLRCKNCNGKGPLSPHQFEKNICKLCKLTLSSPVFVHNVQLDFDESKQSILEKMGQPTEILTEGNLQSLVYASDLSALTVIQTDEMGLWGVFTLDPTAVFYVDGKLVKADGFKGKDDKNSDAVYREFNACRVYAFCDLLGTKKYYGMWLRYAECDYHYLTDPNIAENYEVQARLSYYYVNALRALNGLKPLSWCPKAAKVSLNYAEKMVRENFFDHDNLLEKRLNNAGLEWRFSGENVSQGYANAFFVCDAYYNCADHRINVLNPDFTHVGMGFVRKTDGTYPITVLGAQTFYS